MGIAVGTEINVPAPATALNETKEPTEKEIAIADARGRNHAVVVQTDESDVGHGVVPLAWIAGIETNEDEWIDDIYICISVFICFAASILGTNFLTVVLNIGRRTNHGWEKGTRQWRTSAC